MRYYVLTSSQFNSLSTTFMRPETKALQRPKRDGSSYIFPSSTAPSGFSTKQSISLRDAVILMEGRDWRTYDPDFHLARSTGRP